MPTKNKNRIFNYSVTKRIEEDYGRDLYNVSYEVENMINSFIGKLDLGSDKIEIEDVGDLIDKLEEYSEKITGWAERTSSKMIGSLEKQDLRQWEEHSQKMATLMKKELTKSDIEKVLKQYLDENVNLIKSLPLSAAERVHKIVFENLTTAKRPSTVAAEIMKTGKVTQARANLIARTETGRATTGLTMARASSIGLDWFVWRATGGVGGDGRTRTAHRLMEGVLCKWDDPPNPEKLFQGRGTKKFPVGKPYGEYLPGATFNCRCYPAPLIRIDDIQWPARVHINGAIKMINRKQFIEMTDNKYKIAA